MSDGLLACSSGRFRGVRRRLMPTLAAFGDRSGREQLAHSYQVQGSEGDVGEFSRAIRHMQFVDDAAKSDDFCDKAMLVLQGVTLDGFAVASGSKFVFGDFSLSGDEADG
jgi:hypothetical protein